MRGWEHDLGRKALAALGAARGEDGPAGTGAHAGPETVGLGPTAIIGLERALHDRNSRVSTGEVKLPTCMATCEDYEINPVRSNSGQKPRTCEPHL